MEGEEVGAVEVAGAKAVETLAAEITVGGGGSMEVEEAVADDLEVGGLRAEVDLEAEETTADFMAEAGAATAEEEEEEDSAGAAGTTQPGRHSS